jgi:hypothetical protein
MSTARMILSSLPDCQAVKNKEGKDCLLLPIESNMIFKNDKGEYSVSMWVNARQMKDTTHTAVIRTPKDANIEHLKTVVKDDKKYLPTLMFLNIDGAAAQPQQQAATTVINASDLPY